jgi:ribosomal protein S27E
MTIRFNCPSCDAIIAFYDRHAGKRARCLTCGQILIIPDQNGKIPQKVKAEPQITEPLPGFYKAVFIDSIEVFLDRQNLTTLVFVAAVVSFKFFLAGAMCLGPVSYVVVWGFLLGFYLNIIYETAFDIDTLPQIYLGEGVFFLWQIIRPFLIFFFTMFIVQLPFIIALALLKDKGITYENMWHAHTPLHLLLQGLFIFALFLFPMSVLTLAVGQDVTLLRPDYLIAPVLKAPLSYLIVFSLLVAACALEMHAKQFSGLSGETFFTAAPKLVLNLFVQVLAVIAMRSIGLFYRHYSCYLRW